MAALLEGEVWRARRGEGVGGQRRRWHRVAVAVESIRPDRSAVRIRLAPRFLVAAALMPVQVPLAVAVAGRIIPNLEHGPQGGHASWSKYVDVVVCAPQPPTPWSCLRAQLVGVALQSLHDTQRRGRRGVGGGGGEEVPPSQPPMDRAWGPAVHAVLADCSKVGSTSDGAKVRGGDRDGGGAGQGRDATNGDDDGTAALMRTDAIAGNAWPALVRKPLADDASQGVGNRSGDWGAGSRSRSIVVGGCKCTESIALAIDAATPGVKVDADTDADDSLDRRLEGAAAVALALLSYAPHAHECMLEPPHRWRRHLSVVVAALAQLRSLSRLPPQDQDEAKVEEAAAKEAVHTNKQSEGGEEGEEEEEASGEGGHATGEQSDQQEEEGDQEGFAELDSTDGELGVWLEECGTKVREARELGEPREAAAGVLGLAAAAVVARKRHSAVSFGVSSTYASNTTGTGTGVRRVRREMLRCTRDALVQGLASIGILESLEGD